MSSIYILIETLLFLSTVMFFVLDQSEKDVVMQLVDALRSGSCILFPCCTNWKWAIAIDATNNSAVEGLKSIKQNFLPEKGMILVQDEIMHEKYICRIPETVKMFARNQDEKYIAVMYKKLGQISAQLASSNREITTFIMPNLSVDMQSVQTPRNLLRLLGKPIFVTPALVDDAVSAYPTELDDINPIILEKVAHATDIPCKGGNKWNIDVVVKYNSDGSLKILPPHH